MVEQESYDLDLIFQALADPTRRQMLRRISRSELMVSELARPFSMSLAGVSKHLIVLERARLVRRRRQGQRHYLSLNPRALKAADEWMARYAPFWEERLESLKGILEGS
jgi:DNA-binding transcriptional ArsR family regulator